LIFKLSTQHKVLKNQDLFNYDPIYPLFRKRSDDKTYYKVISELEFEELKIFGKKYTILQIIVIKYPEKLYISELINAHGSIECLNEQQYSEIIQYCQSNFQKI
jgi:hypothetical protein